MQVHGQKGDRNRVDHNEMGPKAQPGHMVQIGKNPYTPTHTRVDHNYLHDLADGVQGGEALRVGGFGPPGDYFHANTVFEYNLLVRLNGDAEILSLKSSANTFRYNTVRASAGEINIRAGQDNEIHGNFMFAEGSRCARHPAERGRPRDLQQLRRDVEDAFLLFAGDEKPGNPPPGVPPSGPFTGHAQVRNAVVAGNTFITAAAGRGLRRWRETAGQPGVRQQPGAVAWAEHRQRHDADELGVRGQHRLRRRAGGQRTGVPQRRPAAGPRARAASAEPAQPGAENGRAVVRRGRRAGGRRLSPPDVGAIEVFSWPVRHPLTPHDVR